MALNFQPSFIEQLKKFVELPDAEVSILLEALTKAGPQFNLADLSNEVSKNITLPRELILEMVRGLGSLYITKDSRGSSTDAFVEGEVLPALKRYGVFSNESKETAASQSEKLTKFLAATLSLEDTLGTAAKAGYVLTQHERILVTARVLTDVRAIFHVNTTDKPHAAVVIHMLRLLYRDMEGHRHEEYFALDSNDIRHFRSIIDRALQKEDTLRKVMADAGVTVLNPKSTF